MAKIGIYIFTHQLKERKITKKDCYFDGKAYYGFNYIISEIEKKHQINYVSSLNFNSVDFVLVSITSYYDILNIRKELKSKEIKTKFIFGGAGISNTQTLSDIAYAICIGRGEGLINGIIEGEKYDNVLYNESDILKIGQAKKMINIKGYKELEVGCKNKCKFCQYGWKFQVNTTGDSYNSGYNSREDTIQNIDFSKCNRRTAPRLNSAIDGLTQYTRDKVNKKITNDEITEKLKEIYVQKQPYFALKLYNIIGFPWEKNIELSEFYESIKKADKRSDKKLNIFLISTHFVPMPFTPLELVEVNKHNFRKEVELNKYQYHGNSINVYYPSSQISSPITAIEQTIVNRITSNHIAEFDNILLTSKYQTLDYNMKIKVIDKYFPGIYGKVNNVCENIIRPFKYKQECN
jgi:radical SAM superfamily enzyme YgiQ (UPF0313 family)